MDWLRRLDAESVDAVITDPPYGINFQSARAEKKGQRSQMISAILFGFCSTLSEF